MISLMDEFQHHPDHHSPLWWENYHFNGYDLEHSMGISLYTAIKPVLKSKEDIIIIHSHPQLILQRQYSLRAHDIFSTGALKMEPLVLMKQWNIHIANTFACYKEGISTGITQEVSADLFFETESEPYGFTTRRGTRYEQVGILQGEIYLNDEVIQFNGKGMRDHSWELRNISSWGEWYWLMGRLTSDDTVSFICSKHNDQSVSDGWMDRHGIQKIQHVELTSTFSSGKLERCHAHLITDSESFDILIRPISTVTVTLGKEQKRIQGRESLVTINNGEGYGFLWYGS